MAVETLFSALVSLVARKAADPILQQFGAMWGIKNKLHKLNRALLAIQSVLADAEERQVRNPAVRDWLADLKGAAYDAEDILDEFNTEVLRRKAEIQKDMMNKVRDFFSFGNPVIFRCVMGNKLKDIAERIDDLYAESAKFNFTVDTQPQTQHRPQNHSYVAESEVIGRDGQKKEVVKLLLDQCETQDVTVLPITGMGGMGKTTFAQLVYNDRRVQKHFQLRMWVCVSDSFDLAELAKRIVVSATGSERDVPTTMDLLQQRLQEVVSKRRYLLVLDDVWNEDQSKWDDLKSLINRGAEGSVIMVTTRNEGVSSVMRTRPAFPLSCLSYPSSWDLFKKRAFAVGVEPRPQLESIGKKIVEKCDGLPLAIKALGSLLRTKSEEREWSAVESSEIWDLPVGEDGILAPLKLSYNDLPTHLKQCFAYCAIFAKDRLIEKEVLIQLWMAQGFIPSESNVELEVKGREIFNELVWRSFFQDVEQSSSDKYSYLPKSGYQDVTTCRMHDLMHDLAQSIMENECVVVLEPAHSVNRLENVRHLNMRYASPLDILNQFPTIRTLGLPNYRMTRALSKPGSLRALELRGIVSTELLKSISRLIHLRHLDLSCTDIEILPKSISMLYNLQTLRLCQCRELRKLPEDMRHMRSLRHICLDGCKNLKHMPAGIGQLSCLQTLTKYIIGSEAAGTTITELKSLNLCGALELYNLKNVGNSRDAKEANMSSKQNLHSLAFCWGDEQWEHIDIDNNEEDRELQTENSEEVLEALKPHSGLKKLVLWRYHGAHFPTWMMAYTQLETLVEIHLGGCIHCKELPPLWQLPSLEVLCLLKLDEIKYICCNTDVGAGSMAPFQAFSSLKVLKLYKLRNLEAWWEGEGRKEGEPLFFPHLVRLMISYCPQLTSLPRLPPLQSLQIYYSDRVPLAQISCLTTLSFLSIGLLEAGTSRRTQSPLPHQEVMSFKQLKSLVRLDMDRCEEFALLLEDEDEALALSTSLRELTIPRCNWMFSSQRTPEPFGLWKHLTSLRSLYIHCCDSLKYWPEEELRALSSLTFLQVYKCQNLTGELQSPSSTGEGSRSPLQELSLSSCDGLVQIPKCPASLKHLSIEDCKNLPSLAEGLGHLTALRSLLIEGCSNLTSMPTQLGCLASLADLSIKKCSNLTSFSEEMQGLTALKVLKIEECPRLTFLPGGLRQQLSSIERLQIGGCPELERRCKRGGEYWDIVSRVPAKIGREQEEQGPSCCTTPSFMSRWMRQRAPV